MSDGMLQMHDDADSFEEALSGVRAALAETRRAAAAYMMATYPNRELLNEAARDLRRRLKAASVEVNAIWDDSQVTVGGAPPIQEPVKIPEADSLCVITAGTGAPLAVDDIHGDPVVAAHAVQSSKWSSWASVPVMVDGCAAGTVCALETNGARHWTESDQLVLEETARKIGKRIDEWMGAA